MRSVVVHAPLDLRVENMPAATGPGPGEVKVSLAAGGICGSDLHYYQHGGFGTIRLKEPMILGHEVAGTVVEVGDTSPSPSKAKNRPSLVAWPTRLVTLAE